MLNPTQLAAFKSLMSATLTANNINEGYDELEGIRIADDHLGKVNQQIGTFAAGNFYITFLG